MAGNIEGVLSSTVLDTMTTRFSYLHT